MINIITQILALIKSLSNKQEKSAPVKAAPAAATPEKKVRTPITLEDWITSSGRYPERKNSKHLTQEVLAEASLLVKAVNKMLEEIGYDEKISISSGFRPPEVNQNVPGAAKRSAHMTGKAMDIWQPKSDNRLGKLIRKIQDNKGRSGILGLNGLMMESIEVTVGVNSSWCHLDTVQRTERPSMEFKP